MNRKQIQLDICRALLEGNMRCRGCDINENEYAVTVDGYSAYILDKKECIFDVSRIPDMPRIVHLFADNENDVEIKKSNELFEERGRILEKYTSETMEIYVDAKILKRFKNFKLFAHSPLERIIAKDDFGRKIGLFLPVRYTHKETKGVATV